MNIDARPRPPFSVALQSLLNSYSIDNSSNTPDFILADYLLECLDAYCRARQQLAWHGRRDENGV